MTSRRNKVLLLLFHPFAKIKCPHNRTCWLAMQAAWMELSKHAQLPFCHLLIFLKVGHVYDLVIPLHFTA